MDRRARGRLAWPRSHAAEAQRVVDLSAASQRLESYLGAVAILNDSQRDNARLKAQDLYERRREWRSVPFRLMVEANRRCNTRCAHCDVVHTRADGLEPELIERLFDEVGWGSMEIMPFAGGEPTLGPIELFARLARRHNQFLNFITNGLLFDRAYYRSIADVTARVHFSLHSHHKDVQERVMPGVPFETLVRNIADAADVARGTGAQILCGLVAIDWNVGELADYVRFVHELGVRRVVFQKLYPWSSAGQRIGSAARRAPEEVRAHVRRALDVALELGVFVESNLDDAHGDPRMQNPQNSPFDVLQDNAGVVELFQPGFCISTAITAIVEHDGTVLPCCRDHIVLGNLRESSFGELWNGPRMQALRTSFFERTPSDYCRRCMAFYNGHA
ncbi:MAG: radical SAM protein [Planctomycetota bacterium]|nr:MAG: radical SAM protein [Planctomycetota bacterium]